MLLKASNTQFLPIIGSQEPKALMAKEDAGLTLVFLILEWIERIISLSWEMSGCKFGTLFLTETTIEWVLLRHLIKKKKLNWIGNTTES